MSKPFFCPASGKPGHAEKADALVALRQSLKRGHVGGDPGRQLQVYLCKACDLWHVGNVYHVKPRYQGRKRRRRA